MKKSKIMWKMLIGGAILAFGGTAFAFGQQIIAAAADAPRYQVAREVIDWRDGQLVAFQVDKKVGTKSTEVIEWREAQFALAFHRDFRPNFGFERAMHHYKGTVTLTR